MVRRKSLLGAPHLHFVNLRPGFCTILYFREFVKSDTMTKKKKVKDKKKKKKKVRVVLYTEASMNHIVNENSGPPKYLTFDIWPVTRKRLPTPVLDSLKRQMLVLIRVKCCERFAGDNCLQATATHATKARLKYIFVILKASIGQQLVCL